LPVEYVRTAGLREGDEIQAELSPTGEIRLTPSRVVNKSAVIERLAKLHATMPLQKESAGAFVRRMREEDRS
jgi:hypothetical protein